MEASSELYSCRRFRRCREKLPLADLLRDESGQLFCKPGMCPNGKNQNTTDIINLQVEIRKLRGEIKNNASKEERLLAHVESLQERLAIALDIKAIETPVAIERSSNIDRNEAVPVLLCTDWHCGAVVKPETVNDLNSYDVDTFHSRTVALFRNALKVITMLRSTSSIDKMVVFLGGDLIDNWLHPEQIQLQELSPTQQIIECEKAIVRGIDYLLANGGFSKILVPCCYGNHGRTTIKMQADNAHATSYEWLMYQSLRRHYNCNSQVEFIISNGNTLYMDVLGKKLRFMHGDAIKYAGGVGGITVPLTKYIYRQDVGIRADHTFLGHFHTLTHGSSWTVNGSLIGPTAYGLKLGFPPERPQQGLEVIDSKRGFTISAPILTD